MAVFFCESYAERRCSPQAQVARLLLTLVCQLLRSSSTRLGRVDDQFQLSDLNIAALPENPPPALLHTLWRILCASIVALPQRSVILIIDGIDKINDEVTRRAFLRNLLRLEDEVLSHHTDVLRILISSRSYPDILEELSSVEKIERDKERQRKPMLYGEKNIADCFSQNACRLCMLLSSVLAETVSKVHGQAPATGSQVMLPIRNGVLLKARLSS